MTAPQLPAPGAQDGQPNDGNTGGSQTTGPTAPSTGSTPDNTGAQPTTPSVDPWASWTWDGNVDSLPPDVAKLIKEARADAGRARTTAKQQAAAEARQQLVQDIGKALGLAGDEPLDPKQLTEALKQSQAAAQEAEIDAIAAQIERDVIRIAYRVGADPERLLDSRAFCDEIDDIEADDMADFAKQVEAKIKTHLEKHPGLRATGQAPARQGADISGGGAGGQRRERPTSLSAAIKSSYGQK